MKQQIAVQHEHQGVEPHSADGVGDSRDQGGCWVGENPFLYEQRSLRVQELECTKNVENFGLFGHIQHRSLSISDRVFHVHLETTPPQSRPQQPELDVGRRIDMTDLLAADRVPQATIDSHSKSQLANHSIHGVPVSSIPTVSIFLAHNLVVTE
ncbi:hypothetical protein OGAPHI_000264 [Ogataea philodendri]|uniref:Uncharacterized protein n=1 Tax=Ogataea philodendri TaxID=1378263 RepID=A0A9P8PGM0_9ASCO|nr:uncharacterized protein OGAPHI_000264 [Ogataea philodendri]KAH3671561.1 hypothetical protein OGAPHI_000264 [Ogataea philodendri]